MHRLIALIGFGGGFLMISPNLREGVGNVFDAVANSMNEYSPFSYIGASIFIFGLLTLSMHRSGRG